MQICFRVLVEHRGSTPPNLLATADDLFNEASFAAVHEPENGTYWTCRRFSVMSAFGAKRTFSSGAAMSAFDPFRSLLSKYYCNAQGDFRFGRRLAHVLQWLETFRGALEGGVIFGFGLVWPGHAGVAIQNTR